MAARYSDRFFGPQGTPGRGVPPDDGRPPGDPRPVPSPGSRPPPLEPDGRPDEIDLVGGSEPAPAGGPSNPPPPADRPWHAEGRTRAALVAALLAGLVAGAYGWEVWRDRQADRVAQSSLDVTADVDLLTFDPYAENISVAVRLVNDGEHPITVTGFTPLDPRMAPADEAFEPVDLPTGDELVKVVDFVLDCSADVDESVGGDEPAVVAHVRTIDGSEHDRTLPLDGAMASYGGSMTEQCSYYQPGMAFSNLYPEVIWAESAATGTVDSRIQFHNNGQESAEQPDIESVEAPSLAFEAAWDGSYGTSRGLVAITVTWSIEDCEAALRADDADMALSIRGSMPSEGVAGAGVTRGYPSTDLIAELIRLSEVTCR